MKKILSSLILCIVILASLNSSGCLGSNDSEAVNETVTSFLNLVDEGDYKTAFTMYEGRDFPVWPSIEMTFKIKGFTKNTNINNITITSENIDQNQAVVSTECIVSEHNDMGREESRSTKQVHFRLQKTDIGWLITKISFNEPLTISEDDLIEIEIEKTPLDSIADNAAIIFSSAILMLGTGLYLNKKDKSGSKTKERTIDLTNATLVQKESIAQFVKFMPAPQCAAGSETTIDVWVKNFSQQPYENFAVKATFPGTLEAKNVNLFFGKIEPGQTAKQTWTIKPKTAGWASVNEPTVVFEYMGSKYMGVLDPIWVQVQ